MPFWRYTWTTMVGYLPITAISVYLGSRLEDLHPTDPLVIGAAALVVVLMLAVRWIGKGVESRAAS